MGDNSMGDEWGNGDELLEPPVLATHITTLCASDDGVNALSLAGVLVRLEGEEMDDDGICSSVSVVVSHTAAERAAKVSLHSHSATYPPAPARACLAVPVKLPNDAIQP